METTIIATKKRVWQVEQIKLLLENDDKFVMRSVVKIYERQTEDEKNSDSTAHNNGVGFNGTDAFIMTKFAKWYIEKGFMTAKQLAMAKKKIMKYAKQLTRIANEQPVN